MGRASGHHSALPVRPDETLLTRDRFREAVFARDKGLCVICGAPAEDAHHIVERRLFPDGGYYLSNGVSLCDQSGTGCHMKAEQTLISCEELREKAGITSVVLPPHLEQGESYTKWGDIILADGRRAPGELFHEPSVQKALADGGVLDRYTQYVKFPRTYHVPWSPGASDDDKVLSSLDHFEGRDVVITLKLDGQNSTVYSDGYVHARSIDSRSHPSQNWFKNFAAGIAYELPQGWRAVFEDVAIEHSIHYRDLPSYGFLIAIWNERNECLSWDETGEWAALLGVQTVPVLYRGVFDAANLRSFEAPAIYADEPEGWVIRVADRFAYGEFRNSTAKWVRPNHVQTDEHWRHRELVWNDLV